MDDFKDYYAVLGVLPSAEADVIRAAYRALANRYHPDKWAGERSQAEIRMKELNAAYEILSDEQKRRAYDECRGDAVRSRTARGQYSSSDEAPKTSAEPAEARNQNWVAQSGMRAASVWVGGLAIIAVAALIVMQKQQETQRQETNAIWGQHYKRMDAAYRNSRAFEGRIIANPNGEQMIFNDGNWQECPGKICNDWDKYKTLKQ